MHHSTDWAQIVRRCEGCSKELFQERPGRSVCGGSFPRLVRTEGRHRGFDKCANILGGSMIGCDSEKCFALLRFCLGGFFACICFGALLGQPVLHLGTASACVGQCAGRPFARFYATRAAYLFSPIFDLESTRAGADGTQARARLSHSKLP
jgi:hypothetical protein